MIDPAQILPLAEWERTRPVLRPLFMREKDLRRLAVGPHLTLLFENVQTVWYTPILPNATPRCAASSACIDHPELSARGAIGAALARTLGEDLQA